jgi:bacteriorhodopsin
VIKFYSMQLPHVPLLLGALHLAIVPMFFTQMPLNVIVFFIISGLAQIFWIIPVLKRWSKHWYYVGIGGTAILIILWVIAVPHNGLSELEVSIELFQIVFIILCSIIIVKSRTIPKLSLH